MVAVIRYLAGPQASKGKAEGRRIDLVLMMSIQLSKEDRRTSEVGRPDFRLACLPFALDIQLYSYPKSSSFPS